MKRLSDYPHAYHELYAVHKVLCRMGFKSDDLYVGLENVIGIGRNILVLELQTQGKTFRASIARMGEDVVREEVLQTWEAFATLVTDHQACPDEDLKASWESSTVGQNSDMMFSIAATLVAQGFHLPNFPGAENLQVEDTFKGLVPRGDA